MQRKLLKPCKRRVCSMLNEATSNVMLTVGSLSTDILIVLALIVVLSVLGFIKGKNVLFTTLLSLYPAALVAVFFPFYDKINVGNNSWALMFGPFAVLALSFTLAFVLIRPYVHAGYQYQPFWKIVEVVALSLFVSGFIIVLLCEIVDVDRFYAFSSFFLRVYVTKTALFAWTFIPLAGIPIYLRRV